MDARTRNLTLLGFLVALFVSSQTLLHGIYRPQNIDDPWYLSMAYEYRRSGDANDPVFGGNTGGVQALGLGFAHVYGILLDGAGWTKANAHRISLVLVLLGCAAWYGVGRRLLESRVGAVVFALLLLTIEPVFACANQARPDTLTFTLVAWATLCATRGWWFPAGLLAVLAVEAHAIGILAGCLVLVLRLRGNRSLRLRPREDALLGLGVLAGVSIYGLLHFPFLPEIPSILAGSRSGGNFLFAYFFETKYQRHLPELILIAASAVWAWRVPAHRPPRLLAVLLGIGLVLPVLIQRPNFHYAAHVFPLFLLFVVAVAERARRLAALMTILLLLLAPQYAFVYVTHRGLDPTAYPERARAAVPDDGFPVAGPPIAWFAFRDRPFVSLSYGRPFRDLDWDEFHLIEDEAYRRGDYAHLRDQLRADYRATGSTHRFEVDGEVLQVRRLRRAPPESGGG